MSEPMKFYRFDSEHVERFLDLRIVSSCAILKTFRMIKETPKGYWIGQDSLIDSYTPKRWISKTSVKRYAYPTKIEALHSFKIRKRIYIEMLEKKLYSAKTSLKYANDYSEQLIK